jgi:hypothetical protein
VAVVTVGPSMGVRNVIFEFIAFSGSGNKVEHIMIFFIREVEFVGEKWFLKALARTYHS